MRLKHAYPNAYVLLGAGAEQLAQHIELIDGWNLCASRAQDIARINHPRKFFKALEKLEINFPVVCFDTEPDWNSCKWLFKKIGLCGGLGVQNEPETKNSALGGYWQQEIYGDAISALFITDGADFVCLGFCKLHTFQAAENYPYVYQGASIIKGLNEEVRLKTLNYADKIIKYFNLKGVFSIDMILNKKHPQSDLHVLEVNPRVSATFELYEHALPSLNVVDEHIRVCEGERLSKIKMNDVVSAYRIVFANHVSRVKRNIHWPSWSKDLPESGRLIKRGEPICSVYADATEGDIASLLHNREQSILNIIN